jgi:IS5 family transposase
MGLALKQTFAAEGQDLRRRAGGYAYAKLYALHAPEVECIGKGKARKPYEFGVKVGVAVTHRSGLMVGARSFPGNPYDGHTLAEQLEQVRNLYQDIGVMPKTVVVDLGYRGVDADNPGVEIIHRGKFKSLTKRQRRWLKRRQAIEPAIGHAKAGHRMDRCWLQGAMGDALHAISCALGYNIRWLMRALLAKAAKALLWLHQMKAVGGNQAARGPIAALQHAMKRLANWLATPIGLGRALHNAQGSSWK